MNHETETVVQRFLRYVAVDTQSDPHSDKVPSTRGQLKLAKMLSTELTAMGAADVLVDEHGYVFATIPATATHSDGADLPTLGFIAHMDTSPACPGHGVQPQIFRNYQGGPLALNVEKDIILSPRTYPELLDYVGCDIITSDGTTLLGANGKAGIAEIMTMAHTLLSHPDIRHPRIRLAFTIDAEIGRSFSSFDIKTLDADYAYTVNGAGHWEKIEYENFNAAKALVTVHGLSVHPGNAKGLMRNASVIAMEFFHALPVNERPENTEGYRGFFMLEGIQGGVSLARSSYLIRDHSRRKFEAKKQQLFSIARALNDKYGPGTVECSIQDTYYNMRDKIDPENMHLVNNAKKAVRLCSGVPEEAPVRGSTDGAYLSYAGLPCPNLSCGGHNFHGRFEFIDCESMEQVVHLLVTLVEVYGTDTALMGKSMPSKIADEARKMRAEAAAMSSLDTPLTAEPADGSPTDPASEDGAAPDTDGGAGAIASEEEPPDNVGVDMDAAADDGPDAEPDTSDIPDAPDDEGGPVPESADSDDSSEMEALPEDDPEPSEDTAEG
jgi:tripeptide aminopeptidase